jgi:hypothetical protein
MNEFEDHHRYKFYFEVARICEVGLQRFFFDGRRRGDDQFGANKISHRKREVGGVSRVYGKLSHPV